VAERSMDKAECPYCGVYVEFVHRGNLEISQDGSTVALGYRCPSCGEGVVVFSRGGDWRRYPIREPRDIAGVPEDVMIAFREAHLALEAGAPRAAACMIRRCVASVCTEQEIPDEQDGKRLGLQRRIDGLKDRLLPATYRAAMAARLLGDAGAHEEAEDRLGPVDSDTARRTIDVVRHMLANLYELPIQVEGLGMPPPEE
jgi:DNA-directed RNA polymerase subunit RPC12/RpoP